MVVRPNQIHRRAQTVGILVLAAALVSVLLNLGLHVEIVMKAAGIPKNASGIGGFVNGAHALVTPALVMVAAIASSAGACSGRETETLKHRRSGSQPSS
jgi:hypothetical protein